MLGKLLKYEVGDTVKLFTPFYGIVLFLTLITSFAIKLGASNEAFIESLMGGLVIGTITFVTVISFTVIITMVYFFIVARFYKNLVKTEGYFMHSLPVNAHSLILSKLISAIILTIITIIFAVLCAFIFVLVFNEISMKDFLDGLWLVIKDFLLTFTFCIGVVNSITFAYASIAMGSLFQNKFLGAILCYIGFSTFRSFINTLVGALTFTEAAYDYSFDVLLDQTLLTTNIISVVFIIISYVITYYIFTNKLNLE